MRDDCEAYIEIACEYGRLADGTLAECKEFWERQKHMTSAYKSRLVLGDGTILDEIHIGSVGLRESRLDDDAVLIQEMAELLGMDVGEAV